jgi:beta-glucanase (GH16 family)
MLRFKCCVEGLGLSLAAALLLPVAVCQSRGTQAAAKTDAVLSSRTLIWGDEFNGPNGSLPDPKKWDVVTNDSGYGNRELEYYTDRGANLYEDDGHLIITARKEAYKGKDGQTRNYTSARIESRGRFDVQYGRIEARIRMPKGKGLWPAFWLLGSDYKAIGWPACGEIDVVENVGYEPSTVHGSLHGPGYSGANPLSAKYTLPGNASFSDGYHVFAIEWEPGEIRFYVDDHLYETQKAEDLPPGKRWAFDHPFFIVLNLAVGGYWPGNPDATTRFPAQMLVDYVRVYRFNGQVASPSPMTGGEASVDPNGQK